MPTAVVMRMPNRLRMMMADEYDDYDADDDDVDIH